MKSTFDSLQRLDIRLSQSQLIAVMSDLKPVVWASMTVWFHNDEALYPKESCRSFEFEEFHDRLLAFWHWITEITGDLRQARYRFNLNALEATLICFGLRVAARSKPSYPSSVLAKSSGNTTIRNRLIRRLENHRRRAVRKLESDVGKSIATDFCHRLRDYQRELRLTLLCPPLKPAERIQHRRVAVLDKCTAVALQGLSEAGVLDIPLADVRKEVRKHLHYSRRGREYLSVPELLRNEDFSRRQITSLILASWRKDGEAISYLQHEGAIQ